MAVRPPLYPNLGFYRKLAKQIKRAISLHDEAAATRLAQHNPRFHGQPPAAVFAAEVPLGAVQLAIAREHGFASWAAFKSAVEEAANDPRLSPADRVVAAVRTGDGDGLAELLRATPALAAAADSQGTLPLIAACEIGRLEIVNALLEAGADARRGDRNWTPLLAAIHAGPHRRGPALDVVAALIAHGAPDDIFTHAALGRVDALRSELPRIKVDARGPVDTTALFLAAWNGHVEAVRVLLAAGADPDLPCRGGQRAWDIVFKHSWSVPHREIARLLLDHGAACSIHEACILSHLPMVQRLLAGDPTLKDQADATGVTPLIRAVLNLDAGLARLLLAAGATDPTGQGGALVAAEPPRHDGHPGAVYATCSFQNANFHDATFQGTVFSNVNLSATRFDNVNLTGAAINNACITGMTIYGIELEPLLVRELEARHALAVERAAAARRPPKASRG